MWDQRYGEEGFAYGVEPNDFLREQVGAFVEVVCFDKPTSTLLVTDLGSSRGAPMRDGGVLL